MKTYTLKPLYKKPLYKNMCIIFGWNSTFPHYKNLYKKILYRKHLFMRQLFLVNFGNVTSLYYKM